MSRRKLEAALQAGKAIETGTEAAEFFQKVEICHRIKYDEKKDGIFSLQYSPEANLLLAGFGNGSIQAFNAKTGKVERDIKAHKHHSLPIKCIRFHPRERQVCLAASAEGKIHALNCLLGSCEDICSEPGNEIYTLDFSTEGNVFASAGKDCDIRIYDTTTNKLVRVFEGFHLNSAEQNEKAHGQRIHSIKFHPEHEHVLVSGGWDNTLKVWDLRTQEGVKRTIHGPHICGDGMDIKGPYILSASWVQRNALQVWDFSDGRLLYTIPFGSSGDGEFLYTAQFCDKGMALAGGSGTGSVKAVNLRTHQVLGEISLGHPVHVLDSIQGGRMFALGGGGTDLILGQML